MPDGARQLTLPDGRRLDLYLSGPDDGTPLVFHHGSPSSGIPDPPFVSTVAERGLRYVGFSRPGYGSSSRRAGRSVADVTQDVAAILDHLGAEQGYAFGWSGGGPHAIACAALLPDRIRAAAIVGGVAPWPAEGLDWFAGMAPENVEEFQATIADPASKIGRAHV